MSAPPPHDTNRHRPPEPPAYAKGWYNGYAWGERDKKFRVLKRLIQSGQLAPASGHCRLCNEAQVPVEYHDEDYSLPYLWCEPAIYILCHHCHINKLHARFSRPLLWQCYLAHVRRGGYASDLRDRTIQKQVAALKQAITAGTPCQLPQLRPYPHHPGQEWFASLSLDPNTLTNLAARPRP